MPRSNLLAILLTALASFVCYRAQDRNPYGRYFAEIMEYVDERYVEKVNPEELFGAAVNSMLGELDENSLYIGPDQTSQFHQMLDQEFGGIGVYLDPKSPPNELVVLATMVDTPAYRAGLLAGDKIVRIDGKEVAKLENPTSYIKGKPGQSVELTIERPNTQQPIDLPPIEREIIQVPSVLGDTRRQDGSWNFFLPEHPRIAYVRVNNFGKHTREEMESVMNQLDEHGYEALILDLRNNPGGYLDAAVSMSDLFLESGTICTIRGRDASTIRDRFEAKGPGTYNGFPMVVLVNRFSASASEIVAAALQDHHRAVVVGERSYGKGSVQSVIRLGHGDRELKLTTAYYFRPSNKKIHRRPDPTQPGGRESENEEWGVIPDDGYRLELSDEQLHDWTSWRNKRDLPPRGSKLDNPTEHDKQLDKAVEYLESQLNKPDQMPNAA
jgi:carboxyl-terminal processing protease